MSWHNLKKGSVHSHFEYANTFSNNIILKNTRVKVEDGILYFSISIKSNMNTINKDSNAYLDVLEMINSNFEDFERLEIDDNHAINGLRNFLNNRETKSIEIILLIEAHEETSLKVEMGYKKMNSLQILSFDKK